jgi:hypothetical protein
VGPYQEPLHTPEEPGDHVLVGFDGQHTLVPHAAVWEVEHHTVEPAEGPARPAGTALVVVVWVIAGGPPLLGLS